jgi:glycosyltransferase involved in cell wall biosynthesis
MDPISLPNQRPKICIVATTPLIVHFFIKQHICELAKYADIILAINPNNDVFTPTLNLPVRIVPIKIQRRINFLADILTTWQLYRLLGQEKPDLLWTVAPKAGLLGMFAGRLAGVPQRLIIFHGQVWATQKGLFRLILKTADKITAHFASHILVDSKTQQQFLEHQGVLPANKAQVLGSGSLSGVDLARFKPDAQKRSQLRTTMNIPENAVVCLFLGRLNADKGVYELARAFELASQLNPHLWLVLVGPDEEGISDIIKSSCGDAANRLKIFGFTDKPEDFCIMSDFLCLPSHREGFGMVILEAGAVGIPAIGSRIYGVVDAIIENETGLLFTVEDVNELSRLITQLAANVQLREKLGKAAQLRVNTEFSAHLVVERYVNFMQNLTLLNKVRK